MKTYKHKAQRIEQIRSFLAEPRTLDEIVEHLDLVWGTTYEYLRQNKDMFRFIPKSGGHTRMKWGQMRPAVVWVLVADERYDVWSDYEI